MFIRCVTLLPLVLLMSREMFFIRCHLLLFLQIEMTAFWWSANWNLHACPPHGGPSSPSTTCLLDTSTESLRLIPPISLLSQFWILPGSQPPSQGSPPHFRSLTAPSRSASLSPAATPCPSSFLFSSGVWHLVFTAVTLCLQYSHGPPCYFFTPPQPTCSKTQHGFLIVA